ERVAAGFTNALLVRLLLLRRARRQVDLDPGAKARHDVQHIADLAARTQPAVELQFPGLSHVVRIADVEDLDSGDVAPRRIGSAKEWRLVDQRPDSSLVTHGCHQLSLAGFGFEQVDQRRSEEHTSELQSREKLVCRLLLEKKKHSESTTT